MSPAGDFSLTDFRLFGGCKQFGKRIFENVGQAFLIALRCLCENALPTGKGFCQGGVGLFPFYPTALNALDGPTRELHRESNRPAPGCVAGAVAVMLIGMI